MTNSTPAVHRWPVFLLLLGLFFLGLSAWSVYRAGSDGSPPLAARETGYRAAPPAPAND